MSWLLQDDGSYLHENGSRIFQSGHRRFHWGSKSDRLYWSILDVTSANPGEPMEPCIRTQNIFDVADLIRACTCECGAFKTYFYVVCDACWLPAWVKDGAVFVVDGKAYRVVSVGSTNQFSGGETYEPHVYAESFALPDLDFLSLHTRSQRASRREFRRADMLRVSGHSERGGGLTRALYTNVEADAIDEARQFGLGRAGIPFDVVDVLDDACDACEDGAHQ